MSAHMCESGKPIGQQNLRIYCYWELYVLLVRKYTIPGNELFMNTHSDLQEL